MCCIGTELSKPRRRRHLFTNCARACANAALHARNLSIQVICIQVDCMYEVHNSLATCVSVMVPTRIETLAVAATGQTRPRQFLLLSWNVAGSSRVFHERLHDRTSWVLVTTKLLGQHKERSHASSHHSDDSTPDLACKPDAG